ncbi:MAG: tetratricopeptide repeat protein [Alphaproteobacteria bacterium]|nr:tetratricopeptide repeat protein [Alphaproteobacteria bacterium]
MQDVRGLAMTAASAEAVAAFDHVMDGFFGFRADVGDRLKAALTVDPDCPLLHCTRGYFTLLLSVRRQVPKAHEALAAARAAAARHGTTPREAAHIAALAAWCAGDGEEALRRWESILAEHPRDVLALKLAQYWHFYFGRSQDMSNSVARALPAWDGVPGHGYVLGLQAFGFEECGDYAAAERAGRWAVEINPADVWAIHAVAHVLEMQDRADEGIAWIRSREADLSGIHNFRFHVWWHRCLFHLELGDTATALDLYDREVRAESTDDYLDITNAVSLLWRLEDLGVDAGGRWAELAAQAAKRIDDHMLVFADAHFVMALAAAGDSEGARRLLDSARAYARTGETEARVMGEVGAALCEALLAHREQRFGRVVELLVPLRGRLIGIGGSHAQRDLFEKILVSTCLADGRASQARALLAERLTQRPGNRWAQQALAKLG